MSDDEPSEDEDDEQARRQAEAEAERARRSEAMERGMRSAGYGKGPSSSP